LKFDFSFAISLGNHVAQSSTVAIKTHANALKDTMVRITGFIPKHESVNKTSTVN
jgi:hypothetical protein